VLSRCATSGGGAGDGLSPAAEQLLAQLAARASQGSSESGSETHGGLQHLLDSSSIASALTSGSSSVTSSIGSLVGAAPQVGAALQEQQPHFGSRLAQQVLDKVGAGVRQGAESAPSQLPQLPALHSAPELPALPALPDLDAGSLLQGMAGGVGARTAAAAGALQGLAHAPDALQQQLAGLAQQLQVLGGGGDGGAAAPLGPHFGSQALLQWLQALRAALGASLQDTAASLGASPAGLSLSSAAGDGFGVLAGLTSSSSSILGSSGLAAGFSGASGASSLDALAASWQVLSSNVAGALPAGVTGSMAGAQAQAAALAGALAQVQGAVLQAAHALAQLPEHGQGGYDFPTLCFVAAGTLAATAASVPPASSSSDGGGADGGGAADVLTHDYDPAAVEAYFKRRPVLVAQRSLQLSVELARFGLSLLGDLATNRLQVCEAARVVAAGHRVRPGGMPGPHACSGAPSTHPHTHTHTHTHPANALGATPPPPARCCCRCRRPTSTPARCSCAARLSGSGPRTSRWRRRCRRVWTCCPPSTLPRSSCCRTACRPSLASRPRRCAEQWPRWPRRGCWCWWLRASHAMLLAAHTAWQQPPALRHCVPANPQPTTPARTRAGDGRRVWPPRGRRVLPE
jgi:hypothetical protein